ncbi:globin domain-containing protein [Actinopolyspora mortivallis]|uniref:nitric oxide dioxygenase n=1 Tax=Actinopolyspora mortivallis TaxID=33906 RepID=A0A2T0H176_ACTMO|nr:globin domain-containing protein [Actinopolyspora mortivallis]PRW65124.1 hemin transporter [Actinopolyspora mortivallis]
MLSEKSAQTVRATLPVVRGAIDEIAARFYDRLFAAHPELLRDLFNRGNQANGTQRRALAGSIAHFASALVDEQGAFPEGMLVRVAHKHASLGVTRDQYHVVGANLFAAIAEVLGEAATDEVLGAWEEVYWLMAESLIAREEKLYAEAGAPDGDTWREYRVDARHPETPEVVTLLLRPVDGGPVPEWRAGQYVSVRVPLPDGARQIRQYSLTGDPRAEELRITVKRVRGEPDGEVSNHLHDHVREGDVLGLSAPFGDVVLEEGSGPVLLASAGIGCTPVIAMLRHLVATGSVRPVIAVHGDHGPSTHAFRAEFERLVAELDNAEAHVWYENPEGPWPEQRTGTPDLTGLRIPPGTEAYLCGPLAFLRRAHRQLVSAGVAGTDIHYEVFEPDHWLTED